MLKILTIDTNMALITPEMPTFNFQNAYWFWNKTNKWLIYDEMVNDLPWTASCTYNCYNCVKAFVKWLLISVSNPLCMKACHKGVLSTGTYLILKAELESQIPRLPAPVVSEHHHSPRISLTLPPATSIKQQFWVEMAKWPWTCWRSRSMTPNFNISRENPNTHIWCKFSNSGSNPFKISHGHTKFPRILSQTGQNYLEGQGRWLPFAIVLG